MASAALLLCLGSVNESAFSNVSTLVRALREKAPSFPAKAHPERERGKVPETYRVSCESRLLDLRNDVYTWMSTTGLPHPGP